MTDIYGIAFEFFDGRTGDFTEVGSLEDAEILRDAFNVETTLAGKYVIVQKVWLRLSDNRTGALN